MSHINVEKALQEAENLVAALKDFKGSPGEHLKLLNQTDKVRTVLEQPYDVTTRLLENMSISAALYTLLGIGALQKLPQDGTSISAAELAAATKVDISAITRTMRVIIANGIAVETAPDEYAHNMLSQAFLPQAMGGFFLVCMDFMKTWIKLPEYFQTHAPEDLYDLKKSPFAFAAGQEGLTYYEVLNLNVEQRNIWNATLQQMDKNMPILGMFPFESLKEQVEKEPERPFIVDVAGGRGQALLAIQKEYPGAFGGKLILQDQPIVIDSLKPEETEGFEATVYDIFTPQPIKNAHVYFMRRLLHDFYNPVCVEILKNTVSAMGPDSRLIICDMVVPERVQVGGPMQLYWLDFSLLTISGKEKTMKEFEEIFNAVGLELVAVYPSGVGETVMLETRLKRT